MSSPAPNPAYLLKLGSAFSASRVFLSAVELDLFSVLQTPCTAEQVRVALNLHERCIPDFPDTLVALGVVQRDGNGPSALYSNTPDANYFLIKSSPSYIGGIFEGSARSAYDLFGQLTETLRTGKPRPESPWHKYLGGEQLEELTHYFVSLHAPAHRAFAERFNFEGFETLLDVGGGCGYCCCEVAMRNAHMTCTNFDLPFMEKIAIRTVHQQGVEGRVRFMGGDFWTDEFERADVIVMSEVLHDFGEEQRGVLIKKAFEALPTGGRLVIIELLIDDERKENIQGLLMSLLMHLVTEGGSNFSRKDCDDMAKKAGFAKTELMKLVPPLDAVIAYK